ncbi:MAG: DoxX family membrane protein [Chitinophagales bacterium]|nr:DoxX family membrane protein [Chitinophagales bacterium]
MNNNNHSSYNTYLPGLYTLALRWVIGWTYFSAFWRRLILENKLIPEEAGYIGEKFNHFLPNALGIQPIIEYLVTHPETLQLSMIAFTIIEAIVGLFIILGLFTRISALGVLGLAMGILLGSGWIGTTCLDEWQIGVLGVTTGFTLFLTGSGDYSIDQYFINKKYKFTQSKAFTLFGSGQLQFKNMKIFVLGISISLLTLTLATNQIFHGGVWGKLHNKSVKPKIEISNIVMNNNELQFEIYRTEGADVYGSFLIGIEILNENQEVVKQWNNKDLSNFLTEKIHNHYVAKVKPGKHSLIIPLGAKADISIDIQQLNKEQLHTLKLIDISGIEWQKEITSN